MSDSLNHAYTDFDGWKKTLPEDQRTELDGVFQFSTDPERSRKRFLATQYLSEKLGKPSDEISNNLESYYLPAYSVAQDGFKAPAPLDLNQFHERVAGEMKMETEDKRVAGDLNRVGMIAAASGMPWPDVWAAHRDANKMAGTPREGEYLQRFIDARDAYGKQIEPFRGVVDSIVAEAERNTSPTGRDVATGPDDMAGAAARFLEVPADKRGLVMEAAALQAESKGYDRKALAQRMAESFQRAGEGLGMGTINTVSRSSLLGMVDTVSGYGDRPVIPEGIKDKEEVFKYLSNRLTLENTGYERKDQPFIEKLRPITPEEKQFAVEQAGKALDLKDAENEIQAFANEVVDPTRYADENWKDQGFSGLAKQSMLGMSATLPMMATAALPGGVLLNAGMYADDNYKQFRRDNPELSREQAHTIGMAAAPIQAALDYVESGFLIKRLSFMGDTLKSLTAKKALRVLVDTGTNAGVEWGAENAQDLAPYAAQSVIGALNQDVPAVDWQKVTGGIFNAKNQAELLSTIIPLSIMGGGAGMVRDGVKARALVTDPASLKAEGFNDEHIDRIVTLANAGDFGGAFSAVQEAFAQTDFTAPEVATRRAEAAEAIKARQTTRQAVQQVEQREAGVSNVVRDGNGWKLRMEDGKEFAVSNEAAAVALVQDLGQARNQTEADAFVALADSWHNQAPDAKRETVATGELSTSDGKSIVSTRNGQVVREITDAGTLETLRKEAELEANQSGNGEINVIVNGSNSFEFVDNVETGVREIVQRLEVNQSLSPVLTFLHESVESNYRKGLASGTLTQEETQAAFTAVAPVFAVENARDDQDRAFRERVQKVASGKASETETRETVSELAVADIVGHWKDGSKTKVGGVSVAIRDAIASAGDAKTANVLGKFYAFLRSVKAQFRAMFGTVAALKKARDAGTIKDGDAYGRFIEKLLGVDVQAKYNRERLADLEHIAAQERLAELEDGGAAFSLSKVGKTGAIGIVDSYGSVEAHALNSDEDLMKINHSDVFGVKAAGADRWRYDREGGLVWTREPSIESKHALENWLSKRGFQNFSLSPGKQIEQIQEQIDEHLKKNPEKRLQLEKEAQRRLANLKRDFEMDRLTWDANKIRAVVEPRTPKQLEDEQAVREAVRADELQQAVEAKYQGVIDQKELAKLWSGRVMSQLARPGTRLQGRIMGKAAAAKAGKIDLLRNGDFDGIDSVPSVVFGGSVMPDQIAQELYEDGFISEPSPDALWNAIRSEVEQSQRWKELLDKSKQEMKAARQQAKTEAAAWRKEQDALQAKDYSPKARLVRTMRMLDAALSVMPPEVRGKVGGFINLAKLETDEARLKEIGRRVEKMGVLLEKHLQKEYDRLLDKLFERAKPKKDEAGKKKVGKAGADIHSLFDTLRAAKDWTAAEVETQANAIEAEILKGQMTPEQEAAATLQMNLIGQIGDWKNADAARRAAAVENATYIFEEGFASFRLQKLMEKENREIARDSLIVDTGKTGSLAERTEQELQSNGFKSRLKDGMFNLLNFEQVLHFVFGTNSTEAKRLADMEREASNAKEDALQGVQGGIDDLFARIAGDRFKGELLHWNLSQKNTEISGVKLSQMEMITASLMWNQADGQRHMIGNLDENGKPAGAWHYGQDFMDELEAALTPEARAVRAHLMTEYAGEWATLNPVYKALNGINLPKNENYAPITVKPMQAQGGQTIDPVTGSTTSGGSLTPGSLRSRGQSIAEPDFKDALQVFIAHKKQMEHWKAYAPFTTEAMALLNARKVGNAVQASGGKEAVGVLRGWLDHFAQGGTRDAGAQLALNQTLSKWTGRAASVALVGRLGTLAVQSTQLGAALTHMPTGAYVVRLGKLLSGNLSWGSAFESPYIQRRLAEMPPVVRQSLEGLKTSKPSMLKHQVAKLGRLIGGADALFTAGSYAITFDYQLKLANEAGLQGPDAEDFATNETERIVDTIAQPTRSAARSLYEVTSTNPISKLVWAFASESRKNLALATYSVSNRPIADKVRTLAFVLILEGLLSSIIRNAWKDARDNDDDEIFDEKNWSAKSMALKMSTGWMGGVPVLGSVVQGAAYDAVGVYSPDGNLFSSVENAIPAIGRLPDTLQGERDTGQVMKDVESILSAMGLANDNIAAAASLSHLVRDLFGVAENAAD